MEIDQLAALPTTLDFHLLLTQSNPPARISLPPLWIAPDPATPLSNCGMQGNHSDIISIQIDRRLRDARIFARGSDKHEKNPFLNPAFSDDAPARLCAGIHLRRQ
jgi:hypothetical protein